MPGLLGGAVAWFSLAAVVAAQWVDVPIQRHNVADQGSPLAVDIQQRTKRIYAYTRLPIVAHETAHFVANTITNKFDQQGIYLGGGRGVILRQPPLTLSRDVAPRVPPEFRTGTLPASLFETYVVKQSQTVTNTRPLCLLDEYAAYVLQAEVEVELKLAGTPQSTEPLPRAKILRGYVQVVADKIAALPHYADRELFQDVVRQFDARLE